MSIDGSMERLLKQWQAARSDGGWMAGAMAQEPPEVTQASLALDRRRARMKAAGGLFPAAVEAAMASVGRCHVPASWAQGMADAAAEFVRAGGLYSLVLCAPPGRGKSWIATWVVAESLERALWVAASDCRVGDSWAATRERALKIALLAVDDLGEEASGDWGVREMATLLESRHNAGCRTVVTTNLSPAEIGARYGERLLSRWSQAAYARMVAVRGEDMRRGR